MAVLRQYDPKEVIAVFVPFPLTDDIAPGTFLTISRNRDTWALHRGTDAEMARVRTNDRSSEIQMSFRRAARINTVLSGIMNADAATSLGVSPFIVTDFNGITIHSAPFSWIKRVPDETFANGESIITWTWECESMSHFLGSQKEVK